MLLAWGLLAVLAWFPGRAGAQTTTTTTTVPVTTYSSWTATPGWFADSSRVVCSRYMTQTGPFPCLSSYVDSNNADPPPAIGTGYDGLPSASRGFAWGLGSTARPGHTIAIAVRAYESQWRDVFQYQYDGSSYAGFKVSKYGAKTCVGFGPAGNGNVWSEALTACTSDDYGFGEYLSGDPTNRWNVASISFHSGGTATLRIGDSSEVTVDTGSDTYSHSNSILGMGWVQPNGPWGGGSIADQVVIGAARVYSGETAPNWGIGTAISTPADSCDWVTSGGATWDSGSSVVSLPNSNSSVTLEGTKCGVSGLHFTVTTAGAAGNVVTWIGEDNSGYYLRVIGGHLWYAHGSNGIDMGAWVAGQVVEWETASGRVRSQQPGASFTPWTPAIAGAKLTRDASVPPRLLLFGDPSSSSTGTVISLAGSYLSTTMDPAADPSTGGDGSSTAGSGCAAIDGVGFDPSSWVPALTGGVECVVSGAVDKIKAALSSLFTYPEMSADMQGVRHECETQAPCSWAVTIGTWTYDQIASFTTEPFGPLPNKCVTVGLTEACTNILDEASPAALTISTLVGALKMYLVIQVVGLAWSYVTRTSTVSNPEQLAFW